MKALFSLPKVLPGRDEQVVCWYLFIYNLIFFHPRCPCFCLLALTAMLLLPLPRCGWWSSFGRVGEPPVCPYPGYAAACFRYWISKIQFLATQRGRHLKQGLSKSQMAAWLGCQTSLTCRVTEVVSSVLFYHRYTHMEASFSTLKLNLIVSGTPGNRLPGARWSPELGTIFSCKETSVWVRRPQSSVRGVSAFPF